MQFTSATAAAVLGFASQALSTHTTAAGFIFIAGRSRSSINLRHIHAHGGNFWIGLPTAEYCPSGIAPCREVNRHKTVFACASQAGVQTSCTMRVMVPGGQKLFVSATGELSYTPAHSAVTPAGAFTDGFTYNFTAPSAGFGTFDFVEGGSTGFTACAAPGHRWSGPWKVYATLWSLDAFGCLDFEALAKGTNATAWQYD